MGFREQMKLNQIGALFKPVILLLLILLLDPVNEAKAIHQYEHPYPQCLFVMATVPVAGVGAALVAKPNNFGEDKVNDFGTISVVLMGSIILGLVLTEQCNDYFFFSNQPPIVSEIPAWPIEKREVSPRSNMISLTLFSYRF